jgi:SNF family Na+-dependent transporter
MQPPKWKIFRFLNYLHILSVIVLIYVQSNSILNDLNGNRSSTTIQVFMVLTLIGLASLIVNSSLNLHFIHRYYPNHLPEKWMRNFSILLSIPALAMIALFIIAMVMDFTNEERYSWTSRSMNQKIGIISIWTLVSSGIYILWNQVSLRKALRHNYRLSIENFLDPEKPTHS